MSGTAAGGCVCCCCLGFLVAVTVGPLLSDVMNVVAEIHTCVNETIGKPLLESMQEGHCKHFFEAKCPEALSASQKLKQDAGDDVSQFEKDCMVLQSKCDCEAVTAVMATKDHFGHRVPHLSERLPRCCTTFENYEDHAFFGNMAKPAGDTCHMVVGNLTAFLGEVADNCTRGVPVSGWNPQDLAVSSDRTGFSSESAIAAKFSMIDDVWQPSTAIASKVQPFAIFGTGAVLLGAAAMGLRRRQAGGGRVAELEVRMNEFGEAECVE